MLIEASRRRGVEAAVEASLTPDTHWITCPPLLGVEAIEAGVEASVEAGIEAQRRGSVEARRGVEARAQPPNSTWAMWGSASARAVLVQARPCAARRARVLAPRGIISPSPITYVTALTDVHVPCAEVLVYVAY